MSQPDSDDAARMELTPDAVRQTDEGYSIECPECGTSIQLNDVVAGNDCENCGARLALELTWESAE